MIEINVDNIRNPYPRCPKCGWEDEFWAGEHALNYDGDTVEYECEECGEKYDVTMNIDTSFSTYPKEKEGK